MAKRKSGVEAVDTKDRPYVSNYPALKEWLDKHEARCFTQLPIGDPEEPRGYVETWAFSNGRLAIITVQANQHGWDIYTPGNSQQIDETFADAEKRLGLEAK